MALFDLPHDARFVQASDVVATDMSGETVMMDVKKGTYFAVTGSGSSIWERLEQPLRLDELVSQLEDEFDAEGIEDFESLIAGFLNDLLEKGLVTPAE